MLIVIEGIDGSGKETQTNLIVDSLKQEGHSVLTLDFPGYQRSPFGKIIGNYLKGGFGDPVFIDPFESALLYAGDRMHSKSVLLESLKRGEIVILNRYVPSNVAYGCAKLSLLNRAQERDNLVTFNNNLEYELIGLPRPDHVIYLDVKPKVATDLIDSKDQREYLGDQPRDKYEMNQKLQGLVRKEYSCFCSEYNNWHLVNCCDDTTNSLRSINSIHEEIRKIIKEEK